MHSPPSHTLDHNIKNSSRTVFVRLPDFQTFQKQKSHSYWYLNVIKINLLKICRRICSHLPLCSVSYHIPRSHVMSLNLQSIFLPTIRIPLHSIYAGPKAQGLKVKSSTYRLSADKNIPPSFRHRCAVQCCAIMLIHSKDQVSLKGGICDPGI